MSVIVRAIGCVWLCTAPELSHAQEISEGDYAIRLQSGDGTEVEVGSLSMTKADANQFEYEVNWDDSKFTDQFLSMRPFKCLEGAEKQWCRVPYPYKNKRVVSSEDLTDLEYDLLFIWKKQGDYGIDMWNGVYYDLEITGQGIAGVMNDMDMDILSAPPDEGVLRPIGEYDIEPAEPDSHWLPSVIISPIN